MKNEPKERVYSNEKFLFVIELFSCREKKLSKQNRKLSPGEMHDVKNAYDVTTYTRFFIRNVKWD